MRVAPLVVHQHRMRRHHRSAPLLLLLLLQLLLQPLVVLSLLLERVQQQTLLSRECLHPGVPRLGLRLLHLPLVPPMGSLLSRRRRPSCRRRRLLNPRGLR